LDNLSCRRVIRRYRRLATYSVIAKDNFDIGEAIVSTGTFALAGALIGTGIGAAAGIQMAANSALAVAASSVGSGVAGGALGYSAQIALTSGDFDTTSFAIAGIGGAIDSGMNLVLPTPMGRMASSGIISAAQSSADSILHGEEYNRNDLLADFTGGVFASLLYESSDLGPRTLTHWGNLIHGNPSFAGQVAKQEMFLAGYETLRGALISSDQMKKPWQLFTKAVVWAGDKLTGR
jgi:hypothetical protein